MARPFTPADDAEILRLRRAKLTFREIAKRIGRHRDTCQHRWCALQHLPVVKSSTQRPCLTCSKLFPSEGSHNRMCEPCAIGASADMSEPFSLRLPT